MSSPFEKGRRYRRRSEIHGHYGGQWQGGISTPAGHPLVLLFTGEAGEAFGYRDEFRPDGTFWYTGEGQRGDMEMVRGNRAIRDHQAEGRTMHLFEKTDDGLVQYVGQATYLAHHYEDRPDADGMLRRAIVFELDITDPGLPSLPRGAGVVAEPAPRGRYWTRKMNELRKLAIDQPPPAATERERKQLARVRSEAVKVYVLRRADGVCEGCGEPAPFVTPKRRPYLEPHHILRVADGGPDHPRWVAALCPNCHRRVHHGQDGEEFNQRLADRLGDIEAEG